MDVPSFLVGRESDSQLVSCIKKLEQIGDFV